MTLNSQSELARFLGFVQELIADGRTDLSLEQALELWREPCPGDSQSTLGAVREALADMAGGDQGIPIEQFNREFREQRSRQATR